MKNKKIWVGLLVLLLILPTFFTVPALWKVSRAVGSSIYDNLEPFSQALTLIQSDYVDKDKTDSKKLIYGAIKGMVDTLDPFSQFMDPDAYKDLMSETKGSFGGIGIEIAVRESILTVIAPIDGTPADKAGIKAGDHILKINDKSTKDMTLMDAVSKMRGTPGTQVTITIQHQNESATRDITITRAIIKIQSVKFSMLEDGIGYVRLGEFMETSEDDMRKAMEDLEKRGMKKLILDLRNNPGGLLDMAVKVAGLFLPDQSLVVYTQGRLENQNHKFYSSGEAEYKDIPLVVLINKGSASASEIVSGAFQDLKRAPLIGQTSFGKASVQTIQPLTDGSALRLTTAHYYTPKGRMIHEKGIDPDIKVDDTVKPTDETKAAFEKDVFFTFGREWTEKQKKEDKPIPDFPKVTESMRKSFLKLCESKQVPINSASYTKDKELIEEEMVRSILDNAKGEEAAKQYILSVDKVVLKAKEKLKEMN